MIPLEQLGAVQPDGRVARLAHRLTYLDGPEDDVRALVAALTRKELDNFGYSLFYLNLLSFLGERMSAAAVARVAEHAVRTRLITDWMFYTRLSRMGGKGAAPKPRLYLRGWESAGQMLLDAGSRAIVCVPHVGDFRDVGTDLMQRERHLVQPLAPATIRRTREVLGGDELREPFRTHWHPADIEDRTASLSLARGLRHGHLVLAYVDANMGADGPLGTQCRSEIDFLGRRIAVKDGVARLAAVTGAPLVPVAAPRRGDDEPGELIVGKAITPPENLGVRDRSAFAADAMQQVYAWFEPYIRQYPEQWESALFLHRWRIPPKEATARPGALRLDVNAEPDRYLRLAVQRVAPVATTRGTLWVHAQTMKIVAVPAAIASVVDVLAGGGLPVSALATLGPGAGELLGELLAEGFLELSDPIAIPERANVGILSSSAAG